MDMQLLLWLQTIRGSFLDSVLLLLTDFVVSPVMYVFVAVLYWCVHKRAALYLAINLSLGMIVNQLFKNTFCVYRPWIRNSKVIPLEAAKMGATGYSFPSGHTQLAATEFLSLAVWQKKRKWFVGVCVFMTLLVMFTRMYLGVHTLSDVLASLVLAVCILFVNAKLFSWIETKDKRDVLVVFVGLLFTMVALTYMALKPYPMDYSASGVLLVDPAEMVTDCYAAAGCFSGFLIGFLLERRFVQFKTEVSIKARFGRSIFGAVVLYLCATYVRDILTDIHMYWGEFVFFFFAFVFILYLYPLIFTTVERMFLRKQA